MHCSICSRKGSLLWFVPRDKFKLLTPEENAATYTFNKQVIKHRFCPVCGIHPYAEGVDPQGNRMAAINIRCLEGIDLDSVPTQHFDGRSLLISSPAGVLNRHDYTLTLSEMTNAHKPCWYLSPLPMPYDS